MRLRTAVTHVLSHILGGKVTFCYGQIEHVAPAGIKKKA